MRRDIERRVDALEVKAGAKAGRSAYVVVLPGETQEGAFATMNERRATNRLPALSVDDVSFVVFRPCTDPRD